MERISLVALRDLGDSFQQILEHGHNQVLPEGAQWMSRLGLCLLVPGIGCLHQGLQGPVWLLVEKEHVGVCCPHGVQLLVVPDHQCGHEWQQFGELHGQLVWIFGVCLLVLGGLPSLGMFWIGFQLQARIQKGWDQSLESFQKLR